MVRQEAEDRRRGEGTDLGLARRPDRTRHWEQVILEESFREAVALHEVSDRLVLMRDHPAPDAAKPLDVAEHPEKGAPEEVGRLGEDTSKVRCVLTPMVQ